MTAEVQIVLGNAKNALTIPAAALGTAEAAGRYTVRIVATDGTTSERKIKVGLNNKVTAEVKAGLEEGERVVTGEALTQTSTMNSRSPGGPPPMGF
ncbi:hypothetical protein [Tardiphaga robiniae]|uniref:Multidrug resistance protein MdtA-like C-terminal permuted SH3 domain-containing protein n=1 Tax=Tardiphaga robiniae TaxID=943830 RepID=A0A163XNH3_9BRAD|nr:hypothetical protein A4A58_15310 [Tardiphaga robiniae]